jgi:hypothetical protein
MVKSSKLACTFACIDNGPHDNAVTPHVVPARPADPDPRAAIQNNNKVRHSTPADFNRLTMNKIEASVSLKRGVGGSVCSGERWFST